MAKPLNLLNLDSLETLIAAAADTVRPPERLTVDEAAERYRWIDNPGNYSGQYTNSLTPYNVEPQRVLTSQDFTGMVFVGPAQCAKTEPALNWVTYTAICDPNDIMIISPTNNAARDFSKRRLGRLYRDTEELKARLLPGKQGNNVFDTQFRSGMLLTLSHPSISELSGKPIPRLWLTDYDRMDQNVDGEGAPFDLARKRATTFRRFGMTVAESSPGFVVENPRWIGSTPHEAPPTTGILALYNRGDRRRWYWKCRDCHEAFEPAFGLLRGFDDEDMDDVLRAEMAYMECPHCASPYKHPEKVKLNRAGLWIPDGMKWTKEGDVTGRPYRSDIASFWVKGPAAAFVDWKTLVLNFIKATEEFDKTGSEEALKTTVNVDQGEPYTPKAIASLRLPEELKSRAEDYGEKDGPVVPNGVRFLMATVDVQAGSKSAFVVHVYGIGVGGDVWHIDMFKIRKSNREDERGDLEMIDPAAYPEDWDCLIEQVIERYYPLDDDSDRYMQIKLVGCDSGGADGVTANAYKFWRRLRDDPDQRGYHKRFQLLKGEPSKTAPHYKVSHPDAQRKDRKAGARGDVPVGFINSNLVKDQISNMLGRTEPGGGMVHFPSWAEDWLYMQLTAETRGPKGWVSTSSRRNEAWDLLYYVVALLRDTRIRGDLIDWSEPPGWAKEWDENDLVFSGEGVPSFAPQSRRKRRSLKDLADELG